MRMGFRYTRQDHTIVFVLNINIGHPQMVTKQSCVHSMQLHIKAFLRADGHASHTTERETASKDHSQYPN